MCVCARVCVSVCPCVRVCLCVARVRASAGVYFLVRFEQQEVQHFVGTRRVGVKRIFCPL